MNVFYLYNKTKNKKQKSEHLSFFFICQKFLLAYLFVAQKD